MTGDKKKDFQRVAGIWFFVLLFSGLLIYLQSTGKIDIQFGIMCIISILLFILFGIWGIITYKKKYGDRQYIRPSRQTIKKEKRYRMFQRRTRNKNIYKVCEMYMKEYIFEKSIMIAILFLLMGLLFWIIEINWGGRFSKFEMIAFFLCIPIISGLICFFDSKSSDNSTKLLENEIKMKGYDIEKINEDFKGGTKCYLFEGLLHIGANYVILCHRDMAFVRDVRDVYKVEKHIFEKKVDVQHGGNVVVDEYCIFIFTTKNKIRLKCIGEEEADLIVEEFAKHGIYDIRG